jgi:hypothetical protein
MRCLYCGKELALLKRLTGGGEFCSDSHKQSYQEEYNRLALSRLLQAQTKGTTKAPAQPPHVSVAVEEPLPELVPEPAIHSTVAPELEAVSMETLADPEVVAAEDSYEATPEGTEPLEPVGFLLESPAPAPPEDSPYLETPYVEAWQEASSGPAMSEWQLQNGAAFSLFPAGWLSLDLLPDASSIQDASPSLDLSPQAFSSVPPDAPLSAIRNAKKRQRFPAGASIAIDIAPTAVALATDQRFVQGVAFENGVEILGSRLLQLSHTAIDFPSADSDVVVVAPSPLNGTASVNGMAAVEDNSSQTSLEALSRLHQELTEQETTPEEVSPTEELAELVEVAPIKSAVDVASSEVPQTIAVDLTAPKGEPPAGESTKPRFSTKLFEIPSKTFPPAKPALIGGDAFPSHTGPLLPNLKGLPLRPKIALARDYAPPGNAAAPSETKPVASTDTAVRTQPPSKPAPAAKPAARLTQPKQPFPPAKQVPAAAVKAPEVRTPPKGPTTLSQEAKAAPAEVAESTPETPTAENAPAATQPKPKPAADVAKPKVGQPKPATAQAKPTAAQAKPVGAQAKPAAAQIKPTADQTKPAADQTKPTTDQTKPTTDQTKPTADQTTKTDNFPNFGIAQPANASWIGSLKVKLGLAILILVMACAYFLGWGGKSNKPASSNPAVATDGSGPSIIMGEGGWVEGWGGDPKGQQAGRQITIYRPSLKLSDYRLEFQGSIDAKSVGWVFRAADPENYYAMKLMTVSSGLSPKVALFKYLVANGRQTQVGRVPIDLAVQQDTVFDIRVDVRGPQFTTYIQGRQVDSWTDDQLKIGGAGFLNEREERGKVKSVSIRYLSGAAK